MYAVLRLNLRAFVDLLSNTPRHFPTQILANDPSIPKQIPERGTMALREYSSSFLARCRCRHCAAIEFPPAYACGQPAVALEERPRP